MSPPLFGSLFASPEEKAFKKLISFYHEGSVRIPKSGDNLYGVENLRKMIAEFFTMFGACHVASQEYGLTSEKGFELIARIMNEIGIRGSKFEAISQHPVKSGEILHACMLNGGNLYKQFSANGKGVATPLLLEVFYLNSDFPSPETIFGPSNS